MKDIDINTMCIYIFMYIHTRVYPNVGKTNRSWHHFCSRALSKKLVHQLAASWLESRFDDPESIKTSKSWHGTAWAFQMSSHQNVHCISFVFFGFCFIFKLFIFLLRVFHLFHLFCLFCLRRLFHLFRVFCLFRVFRFFHFREAFGKALHDVDSQNHIHQDHCHDGTVHPSLITIWPWRDPWSVMCSTIFNQVAKWKMYDKTVTSAIFLLSKPQKLPNMQLFRVLFSDALWMLISVAHRTNRSIEPPEDFGRVLKCNRIDWSSY